MYYEEHCVWTEPRLRNDQALEQSGGVVRLDWVNDFGLGTRDALGGLWLAVVRGGGAIGFRINEPAEVIFASAGDLIAAARAGVHAVLTATLDGKIIGGLVLTKGAGEIRSHCGLVSRVMIHPQHQRNGLGTSLLGEAALEARRMGMEQLLLCLREGEGLSVFYQRRGWAEVGRWTNGMVLGDGQRRDEVWLQRHV